MKFRKPTPQQPKVVDGGAVTMTMGAPVARKPQAFATRNCVHCGAELPDREDRVRCPACHRSSTVALCSHTAPRPAWRITRWGEQEPGQRREKDVVAVAVGDVTVFLGRFRDALQLRAEDGTRLEVQRIHAIEPGVEILGRMTQLGTCYRCRAAFYLADCEITWSGPPRILRVAIDQPAVGYERPMPLPSRVAAAYLTLGTEREDT